MAREALRLRDSSSSRGLRPDPGTAGEFNSALRSDYTFIDGPLGKEETFLNTDPKGYDKAVLSFTPTDVILNNPYVPYGNPLVFIIVRSPAGFPVTTLDGSTVASYDFTDSNAVHVLGKSLTSNVATLSATAHGFTVGMTVSIVIGDSIFDGTYVLTATTTNTFSYALVHANVSAVAVVGGYAYHYGQAAPIPVDGKVLVTDVGLLQGRFYYYALYAKYINLGNTYWLRLAISEVLIPTDHGYGERLWDLVPEYYRRLDSEQVGNYTQGGVLRRFINTLGYEVDLQRTWIETIGDVWDVQRLNSRMLPYLGDNILGLNHEAIVGDKRYRNMLSNIMYLRKFDGTQSGIEGFLTALTGYKTIVYVGKNLFLTNNDTEMRANSGNWEGLPATPGSGFVLTRVAGSGAETGGPTLGSQFFHTLTNSTGSTNAGIYRYSTTGFFSTTFDANPVKAIPVVAGHSYRLSTMVRQSAVGTVQPLLAWYSATGFYISETAGSTIGTTTGWTSGNSGWITAPAGAVYCVPEWDVAGMLNTGTIKFWKNMFVDRSWTPSGIPSAVGVDPSTTYESARMIFVSLYPQRTNFAVNANVNVNPGSFPAQGWTTTEPATYDLLAIAYPDYSALAPKTVTNKALTSNVATLTTSTAHRLVVNSAGNVKVSGVGAPFDGTWTVLATPTSTTFTYAVVNANITSVASGGTVVGPEVDYTDLAATVDPFVSSTTVTFDTANHWISLNTLDAPPNYLMQLSSVFFPVVFNVPYSVRVEGQAISGTAPPDPGTQPSLLIRFRWYTSATTSSEIPGTSVSSPDFTIMPFDGWLASELANVTPPPGALYGRVVIETRASVPHEERLRKFLIEDAVSPGVWFDGNVTDGAFGDFRFTGTTDQSFSIYYQNFNAVLNGLSSSDRVHSVLPSLIPPERDYTLQSALNGLFA